MRKKFSAEADAHNLKGPLKEVYVNTKSNSFKEDWKNQWAAEVGEHAEELKSEIPEAIKKINDSTYFFNDISGKLKFSVELMGSKQKDV